LNPPLAYKTNPLKKIATFLANLLQSYVALSLFIHNPSSTYLYIQNGANQDGGLCHFAKKIEAGAC
jgi:hypothetical protein